MERSEVIRLMSMIGAEFGDKFQITAQRVDIWHSVLSHASAAEGFLAVSLYLGTPHAFAPQVGEINQLIIDSRKSNTGLDWGAEWTKVLRAASNSSYNAEREAKRLHPKTLTACGGIAGLKELAMAEQSTLMTHRAQFRQRFESYHVAEAQQEVTLQVQGKVQPLIEKVIEQIGGVK